jgi:hypothetical protein
MLWSYLHIMLGVTHSQVLTFFKDLTLGTILVFLTNLSDGYIATIKLIALWKRGAMPKLKYGTKRQKHKHKRKDNLK